MGTKWATGQNAIAECDVCGFQYKLRQLRKLVVKGTVTEIKACPACWVPDQPQLWLGTFPVYDPQAIYDPRPDTTYPQSRSQTIEPTTLRVTGFVGNVTVTAQQVPPIIGFLLIQPGGSNFLLQIDGFKIQVAGY